MPVKILDLKNTQIPVLGSWTLAVRLRKPALTLAIEASGCRAELRVNGELFTGRGETAVVALQDLTKTITEAAVKRQARGRAPDRVRVAASLLQGGAE